jgi:small subunit ribosomal protein S21
LPTARDSDSGAPLSQVLFGSAVFVIFGFRGVVLPQASAGRPRFAFCEVLRFMQILVRDNNVDQALRALKKKLQREGVYREMKLRRHYEKPSEKRAREKAAAVRRARKLERKRMERDGAK